MVETITTNGEASKHDLLSAGVSIRKSEEDQGLAERSNTAHTPGQHEESQVHHHHSHAKKSRHTEGHHPLQVEDLSVSFMMYDPKSPSFFKARKLEVTIIHKLSLSVHAGEILAVVGASGSGKTLLADAILGLYEPNAIVTGKIWFDGQLQDAASLARLRGRGISLVPQSTNYLDPLMKVGKLVRGFGSRKESREKARDQIFKRYNLGPHVKDLHPFEISGGMARRILLVSALIDGPKLIIADEPTPGLDLELATKALSDFRDFANQGNGVMLITHDIELALQVADRVAVFKEGTVVEETAVSNFASPDLLMHPFTKELWYALPEHDFAIPETPSETANSLREEVPEEAAIQNEGAVSQRILNPEKEV